MAPCGVLLQRLLAMLAVAVRAPQAMNMSSLYQMGALEATLGSLRFLATSLTLLVGSCLMLLALSHVLIHKYGREAQREALAMGYSCVLFGQA